MPGCARPFGYVPRQTHECDAAVLVRRHLAEFLGRCEERAGPLPAFVKGELEGFAGCGDFELGFVRTCCRSCGDELRVPFSCKSRGCCPSCMGRRMAEGAALLVDHVLPAVGGPAARLPHDPLLRRARQPPSPARARHPQARRTAAAATARAGLRPPRRLPPNPRPRPRPDPDASPGQSSSPASSRSTSPAAENAAAACVSSRSSPMPTPSPESSTAPALPLRLLLLDRSCCSPDRAPLRRRVHPPAPCCRPHCPSRAPDRALRHARASPRAQDRAKIPRPRAPRRSPGRSVLTLAPKFPLQTA
jgi:hypothetical protein